MWLWPVCNIIQSTHRYGSSFNQECEESSQQIDAVNKAYVDRIKYKTTTGIILNIAMTDHTLFRFPATKALASGKIILCEMWVEPLAGEWIETSSPMFAAAWPGFHNFSRGPSLMTFFSGSPPVVGLAHFASTILNYHNSVYKITTIIS